MFSCADAATMLQRYIDEELTAEERADFFAHMDTCPACKDIMSLTEAIKGACAHLNDDLIVPDTFTEHWIAALKREKRARRTYALRGGLYAAAAALIVCLGLTLPQFFTQTADYSSNATPEIAMYMTEDSAADSVVYDAPDATAMKAVAPLADASFEQTAPNAAPVANGVKVLRSGEMSIETTALSDAIAAITDLAQSVNGYIVNTSVNSGATSSAYLTLRVPNENLDWLMDRANELGKVTYRQISAQDISAQYADTGARLSIAKEQRERIQSLYDRASTIDDLLRLEQELTRLQYDIDYYSGSIGTWDVAASMPTLSINLREVLAGDRIALPDDAPLSTRMREAWYSTLNAAVKLSRDFMIWLAAAAPVIALLIPVIVLCALALKQFFLIKRFR